MTSPEERTNMAMISVTLPSVTDEQALAIKKQLSEITKTIDDAVVDMRIRDASIQQRPIQGGLQQRGPA